MNLLILTLGKSLSKLSKLFNLGHGSTWPGHIALRLNRNFTVDLLNRSKTKIILITGTNGKTTTAKLLETILEKNNQTVLLNSSGANLLNGIASSIILKCDLRGNLNFGYAIFEVDENALPQITKLITPDYIIALNLFRDQLDRYGEINTVAKNWTNAYRKLDNTQFILNADDPQVAYLGNNLDKNVHYFGLNDPKLGHKTQQHAADSILCPKCSAKLDYDVFYFSHLGKWKCKACGLTRPKPVLDNLSYYPLLGTYAIYDILAAALTAQILGVSNDKIENAFKEFKPAFGRQEVLEIDDKKVQLFLSKNPTSFNESLRTINESHAKNLLIVLNDRIPDGTDISWIWDIDFEILTNRSVKLYLAGDRVYDLALRLRYSNIDVPIENIFENLEDATKKGLVEIKNNETLYILPTYSAMLDVRKILTGKKIL
jgi:lipid II isoglutaminyl synthase (glutamine-hydrolysing)